MIARTVVPDWLRRALAPRHWTSWLLLALGIWSLPRLLPHLGALVNVTARDGRLPTFVVRTLADSTITSQSLRGRVVLVNVWATWCAPCRVEMPLLEATWNRHRAAGLVVLGASVDQGDPRTVQDFITSRGISYPIAIVGSEVLAALADGCSHSGAKTLDKGRCAELQPRVANSVLRACFLITVVRACPALVGFFVMRFAERPAGPVPLSGKSLGWSGCPGAAHAMIFRPRARGYAPDSVSLFLTPVMRTFPSGPIFLVTRGKWMPRGHRHCAATPRIHAPIASSR
jgi:thiol-disulfide isomerase/thioredoxin